MTTLQVTSEINIEFDKVLDGMARLDTFELERFLWQASILLAQRKAPSLPKRETELLQKINQGLPATLQKRYDELSAKIRSETLEAVEHQELLKLIEQTELVDAERMKHLIELAGLRNVSLDALMNQLDIHCPFVHA